jgi:hypothetical protein
MLIATYHMFGLLTCTLIMLGERSLRDEVTLVTTASVAVADMQMNGTSFKYARNSPSLP